MSEARKVRKAKITGLGCYVPPGTLTNADLEKMVATTDEWILTRTGISNRYIADENTATSDIATEAALSLLEQRNLRGTDIEAIIVCTVTPDMLFPSTACLVQDRIGAKGAWGFDLVAACSGLLYGLTTAAQLVASGSHDRVMVIGADTMSKIIDYQDRATCVLFGDGAGAMLIEPAEDGQEDLGLIDFLHEVDGSGGSCFICLLAAVGNRPHTRPWKSDCTTCTKMDGRSSSTLSARCTKSART